MIAQFGQAMEQEVSNIRSIGAEFEEYDQMMTQLWKNGQRFQTQFDSLKAANIYSDFGCSTSYVQYNTSENKDMVVYSYEGKHTQDIITGINNEFNTNYSVKDVVMNPDCIWQGREELFDRNPNNEDRYNQIINKND